MLEIDHYAYQSRWRNVSPLIKMVLMLILLVLALSSKVSVQIGIFLFVSGITCYGTRITPRKYLRWLTIPIGFLVMSLFGILLSITQSPEQLIKSVQVGSYYFGLHPQSLIVAKETFFRSLACLAVTYCFVLSTPFDQIFKLGKTLHLPQVLLENIMLTYRFIFIFLDEMMLIKRAQTLRFGYSNLKNSYRSLGILISMLLERTLSRYEQMQIVLDTKLFQGDFHI